MEKCLIFVQTVNNSDRIYVTELPQGSNSDDSTNNVFTNPVERASFQDEKIIKILSLSKNLKFSSFYIFVLTKRSDNNYFLYLLNERFEKTRINISKSISASDVKPPTDFRIIDFSLCEKFQDKNYIPIVFIVKYLYNTFSNNNSENHTAYAAFFRSLNEDEVMINNSLSIFSYNNKPRKPIFFVPNSFKKKLPEQQDKPSDKPQTNFSAHDERPTLIQFSPPYFIYFRNRVFNIIIMKKDTYQSLVLNDQPLRTKFCQFIHQEAALFVFNEIISIIDFSKQLNLPVHIFPYGKLRSDTKFYYENNILYIYTQRTIYKVPILLTQVSGFSNIFSIPDDFSQNKPTSFTIACNNFILRYENEFRVAKPKNPGTFAATLLMQNGNVFECINSLDNQPSTNGRKLAYQKCFHELWEKDHKEEALMIACNPHFRVDITSVISLFEIFNESNNGDKRVYSDLDVISATMVKKEDYLEIYKRLKFYLDQCRQRFKEKGASSDEVNDIHDANAYVIMYLCFFHKQKELVDFLKEEKISNEKESITIEKKSRTIEKKRRTTEKESRTIQKVKKFFNKFKKECKLDIEESLFYAGIGDYEHALELFESLDKNTIEGIDKVDGYKFSPRMEAIKILKKIKPGSTKIQNCKWILDGDSSKTKNLEPYVGIYYYLPSEEDYNAKEIDKQYVSQLKSFKFQNVEFNFDNWICKYYIEWLRCKGLNSDLRLEYAIDLFHKLKKIQENIKRELTSAQKFLNSNKNEIIWINSIQKYFQKKEDLENNSSISKRVDLNPTSALEEAIKDIQEIIREVINLMKKDEKQFQEFKRSNHVQSLIDMQDIDFKKDFKWLIEDYKAAIELEAEGTTSESQIIKKCKQATDPSKAFESFDEGRKDLLEKKTTNNNYEWKEKIEFINLADFIQKLPDSTTLDTAAPFLSSAISLMTSRIHNLQQRINIQKQVLAEEKMVEAYNQILQKVENQSHELNPD